MLLNSGQIIQKVQPNVWLVKSKMKTWSSSFAYNNTLNCKQTLYVVERSKFKAKIQAVKLNAPTVQGHKYVPTFPSNFWLCIQIFYRKSKMSMLWIMMPWHSLYLSKPDEITFVLLEGSFLDASSWVETEFNPKCGESQLI